MKNALLLLLLFAVAFGATLLAIRWSERGGEQPRLDLEAEIERSRTVTAELAAELERPGATEIVIDAGRLEAVILKEISDSTGGRRLLEAASDLEVRLDQERLDLGLTLAVDALSLDVDDKRLENAIGFLRLLPGDDLRIGVRGRPVVRDGELGLATAGLELVLGPLTLDAVDLEERLGVRAEELVAGLRLGLGERRLDSVRIEGDRLLLGLRSANVGAP